MFKSILPEKLSATSYHRLCTDGFRPVTVCVCCRHHKLCLQRTSDFMTVINAPEELQNIVYTFESIKSSLRYSLTLCRGIITNALPPLLPRLAASCPFSVCISSSHIVIPSRHTLASLKLHKFVGNIGNKLNPKLAELVWDWRNCKNCQNWNQTSDFLLFSAVSFMSFPL